MPRVLYFAQARDVAGRASDDVPGATVAEVLEHVIGRCGPAFEDVLSTSRVWVNGEPAENQRVVGALDEVAILPPVSGGSDPAGLSLADLRTARNDLQRREDAVSYVRRIVQGRLDIARAEKTRRAENRGGDIDVSGEITRVFAAESAGGSQRPPRDTEPSIDDPLVVQLEALCDRIGFGSVHGLDDDELNVCIDELSSFEAEVSRRRRELFATIDALSAELVRRYKTHDSSVDERLDD
jgi:molybdopterin converting factor small subunit